MYMPRQLIHAIGFSEGQIIQVDVTEPGIVELLISGPRGGIIALVQLDLEEFYFFVKNMVEELSK
jgi:hypothetical protein